MAEEGEDFITDLVQQMREENGGKFPAIKKVAEVMGVSVPEAKEILAHCREVLPPAKKQKTHPGGGAGASASHKPAPEAPVEGPGDIPPSDAAKPPEEPSLVEQVAEPGKGDMEADEDQVEETLVDVPKDAFAASEGEVEDSLPDRQPDVPSPLPQTPQPVELGSLGRSVTQRLACMMRFFDLLPGPWLQCYEDSSSYGGSPTLVRNFLRWRARRCLRGVSLPGP